MDLFRVVKPGTEVQIASDFFQKGSGFTRGRVEFLISSVEDAISEGGFYRVTPIDGTEAIEGLQFDLHRTVFTPLTPKKIAADLRREKKRKDSLLSSP